MTTVIQIGRSRIDHPSQLEGALFLGNYPLPGLAVLRRRDGGASIFSLIGAVQVWGDFSGPTPRIESRPLDLGEAMDYPWHAATRITSRMQDHRGVRGDIVVILFGTVAFPVARNIRLINPLQLPRIRALLERGGRSIAQNTREETWRRRAEAVCMSQIPRLGNQGSCISRLDLAILQMILGDSFPNPVDRGRVLPGRFPKIIQ